jgi:hypothetical protein
MASIFKEEVEDAQGSQSLIVSCLFSATALLAI